MIHNKFFQLSLLIELILTFFIPETMIKQISIIVYKYGFPLRYLEVYSKETVDSQLITILFTGNSGINLNLIALVLNLIIIYIFLYFMKFIIKKE